MESLTNPPAQLCADTKLKYLDSREYFSRETPLTDAGGGESGWRWRTRRWLENYVLDMQALYDSNWCHLIKTHISRGSTQEALSTYLQVRRSGLYIAGVVPLVFKACALSLRLYFGRALHCESIKFGVNSNVTVGTSLLGMYARCGDVKDARMMFDEMPERSVVTWNAMIGGCLRNLNFVSALDFFERMPERTPVSWIQMVDGFARSGDIAKARDFFNRVPHDLRNVVTWTVMVDGYARGGNMGAARAIFEAMPERNYFVWSSMISGYCKRGDLKEAKVIFDSMPIRNLVNWNSLISGYVQNGAPEEALTMFRKLLSEGFEPDEVTVTSALSACAQLGQLDTGRDIHQLICQRGVKINIFVLNALLDMYSKCGDLSNAGLVFRQMAHRTTACWNSMITGFAVHGRSREAIEIFRQMENSNEIPNEITFLSLLSACAHGGLVHEGLDIFSKMEKYGVLVNIRHYGCLIDLLARSGQLKEAFTLIKEMPLKPNDTIWVALLGACHVHSNTEIAEQVMREMRARDQSLDPSDGSGYVLLANIFAASERWEKAEKLRIEMMGNGAKKTLGHSSVSLDFVHHQFQHSFSQ